MLLAAFTLIAAVHIIAAQSSDTAAFHLRIAQKAVDDGDYDVALDEVKQAAALAPKDGGIQFALATILDKKNEVGEALAALRRAQQAGLPATFDARAEDLRASLVYKARKSVSTLSRRASAKLEGGDVDGALADSSAVLLVSPDGSDYTAYNVRGRVELLRNELDAAIADFDAAIKLNPKASDGYGPYWLATPFTNRAIAFWRKGNLTAAATDFTRALELSSPFVHLVYFPRGDLEFEYGDWQNSLADYEKGIEAGSKFDVARYAACNIWLIRARLGQRTKGTTELTGRLLIWGKPVAIAPLNRWTMAVGRFLTDVITEEQLFAESSSSPKPERDGRAVEALFYAGYKHLLDSDKPTATKYFQQVLSTGRVTNRMYFIARAELTRLQ
jgi:tetratricopeptide (TPR) repeat protein